MAPCTLPGCAESSAADPAELVADAICTAIGLPGVLWMAVSSHLPPDLHAPKMSCMSVDDPKLYMESLHGQADAYLHEQQAALRW